MEIKAIPTIYNGVQFRSKLEAQYALLFDLLYVEWAYEPAQFTVGFYEKHGYIPDFYLKDEGMWVEIKPPNFTGDERHNDFFQMMGDCFVVVKGSPFDSEEYIIKNEEFKPLCYVHHPSNFIRALVNQYQQIGPMGRTFTANYEQKAKAFKHYIWSFDFEENAKNINYSDYGAKMINRNDMGMEILKIIFKENHGRLPRYSNDSPGCICCEYDELKKVTPYNSDWDEDEDYEGLLECQVCFSRFSEHL